MSFRDEDLALEYRAMLIGLRDMGDVGERLVSTTETLRLQALTYAYGRQDAGEEPGGQDAAENFANAYGLHAARYARGLLAMRETMREAWVKFQLGVPLA